MKNFLSVPCLLCAENTQGAALCPNCQADCPIMPPACPKCAMPWASNQICGRCRQNPPEIDEVRAIFRYAFPVNELITLLKYKAHLSLAQWFAQQVPIPPTPVYLIPIPTAPDRLKTRGFNQSALIAQALSRLHPHFHVLKNVLKHSASHRNQTGLNREKRLLNIRGAFFVESLPPTLSLPFCLLDDVMTTGATLNEAAHTLKKANILNVRAQVLARRL